MKHQLDPDLAAIERRAELARRVVLLDKIRVLTSRVPRRVLDGSAQDAVNWKLHASRAASMLTKDRITSHQLEVALAMLEQYE